MAKPTYVARTAVISALKKLAGDTVPQDYQPVQDLFESMKSFESKCIHFGAKEDHFFYATVQSYAPQIRRDLGQVNEPAREIRTKDIMKLVLKIQREQSRE